MTPTLSEDPFADPFAADPAVEPEPAAPEPVEPARPAVYLHPHDGGRRSNLPAEALAQMVARYRELGYSPGDPAR